MSYEPQLVIRKSDLDRLSDKFENDWEWEDDPETAESHLNNFKRELGVI